MSGAFAGALASAARRVRSAHAPASSYGCRPRALSVIEDVVLAVCEPDTFVTVRLTRNLLRRASSLRP